MQWGEEELYYIFKELGVIAGIADLQRLSDE